MLPSAASHPVPVGERRQKEEEDNEDEGGVNPAMKAVVFAFMAGAMIWTIAVANSAQELPNLDVPSAIALHLIMIGLLIVCVVFLLVMVLINCIQTIGRIGKWRKSLSRREKQCPLLV